MSKTIMVIEDDELHMKMLNALLQGEGYNTIPLIDGNNAMTLARKNNPDLIVLDIQLPGISGLEIVGMLKADNELKDIPVIAVTAFAMEGDKERMLKGGFDAYISKPISITTFLEMVAKFAP